MSYKTLYDLARQNLNPRAVNSRIKLSDTSCAILAANGKIYSGVNMRSSCGLGYCAENAAITFMLNDGETQIKEMIILDKGGYAITPCGRCLELITQLDEKNRNTIVWINEIDSYLINDLFPVDWKSTKEIKRAK